MGQYAVVIAYFVICYFTHKARSKADVRLEETKVRAQNLLTKTGDVDLHCSASTVSNIFKRYPYRSFFFHTLLIVPKSSERNP